MLSDIGLGGTICCVVFAMYVKVKVEEPWRL